MGTERDVLVVAEQLRRPSPGGIGTYTAGLLSGLAALSLDGGLGDLGIGLYASAAPRGEDPLRRFGFPLRTSRLSSRILVRAWDLGLRTAPRGVDVVHHVSLSGPGASVPVVTTVYDLAWRHLPEAFPPRGRRWHEAALSRALRHRVAFVVPSAETRAELLEAGASAEQVNVIAGAGDHLAPPDEPGARRLLAGLGVEGEFLLSVATIEPRKNLARLLEAYGRARAELAEAFPLVLVGPSGWGSGLGELPAGVVLAGRVAPGVLAALYGRARLVCYVPLLEGFGLPVLEAMVAGAPVVSSPVPSANGACEMVDALDVDSIAAGLVAVATSEERRAALRAAGRRHAQRFSWKTTASAHATLWRAVARR